MQERLKKQNQLYIRWSKGEKDLLLHWPRDKADIHLLHLFFSTVRSGDREGLTLTQELLRRGYDLKTLKFSIAYKEEYFDGSTGT